jgi:hypothetical protein
MLQTDFQSLYRLTAANPDPEVGILERYVTLLTLLVGLNSGSGFTTAVLTGLREQVYHKEMQNPAVR